MKEFYIEVSFPPFPNKGKKVRVFSQWNRDTLSPDLVALYRVKAIDKDDALAKALLGEAISMITPQAEQMLRLIAVVPR